jgi:signal transduction histidine kinase/ActR/RegA family two-component response regulator
MHWRGKTFQVRVEPLRGHDGKTITGTIGVVLDITAQKQTLAQLKARIRQQEVVADLGRHALTGTDLGALLDEAAVLVAHTLEVEFSGVWKLQAEENALLLRAGVGWRDGSVGHSRLPVGSRSPISLTLQRYEPVLVEDLSVDQRFPGAGVLHEHGINGSVSIPVQGKERPFGVLSAHSATGRTFTAEDVHFLQAIANVLAAAIERQLAEQELRRSEAKNQAILKALPDLIFRLNRTGEFLNGKASEATDWPVAPAHIAGQKLRGVLPVEVADQWQQNLIKALETGAMQAFEFQLARPRGVHDYEARFVPSGDGDILAVVRDVTERKRLEEQLRQAQKTEAIGRLAGGVAHDFNNLLTAILGYSELLLLDLVPGHPMHEGLAEIKKAAERAAALTRQLLAFSRKQVIAPQILDLNAILGDMGKMLGRLIGENIELVTSPAPAPAPVKADPNQLQQVLMNLAVNARDAMPRGGRLTLTIALVTLDETFAQRHLEVKPGPYVLLQVSDTGCGMSEEVRRHIFEPFFTTKGLGLGTGLGLSTVYGIIKQNGGHVEVASEPDQGTMFRIYLPRSSELVGGAELEGLAAPVPGGRETVLVVEDEEVVRALVRTLLGQQGYTILEAANGEEALRVAGRHSGPIHLLLTDVIMPGMSGREAAQRLTARYPDLRVLYLSGYTDDALGEHGILEPDIDFLHKPFNQNSLIRKVRELLDANRSPQLRPSLASEI